MNIMIVDYDHELCAQAHPQKHVSKLILEQGQMAGTAHRMLDGELRPMHYITTKGTVSARKKKIYVLPGDNIQVLDGIEVLVSPVNNIYLNAYENHPCTKWVRASKANYLWQQEYARALNDECIYRGASSDHLSWTKMQSWGIPKNIPDIGLTEFPRAFKVEAQEECMAIKDVVDAYRHYYMFFKTELMQYKKRTPPAWMPQDIWNYNEEKDLWTII